MGGNFTNLVHQSQDGFVVPLRVRGPQVQQYDIGPLANLGELIELLFADRARCKTIAQCPGNRFSQPRILRQEANSDYFFVQCSKLLTTEQSARAGNPARDEPLIRSRGGSQSVYFVWQRALFQPLSVKGGELQYPGRQNRTRGQL